MIPRFRTALCFPLLILVSRILPACTCQSSYGSCNEVGVSNLVFIGTVELIEPIFLNRWNLTSQSSLQSLNKAYLDAKDHPSSAALSHLVGEYLKSFPDLAPEQRQRLQAAKTTTDVSALFYSTLNGGQRIHFKVNTLFKHEEDDDDDVAAKPQTAKPQTASQTTKDAVVANAQSAKPASKNDDDHNDEDYFDVSTPFGDCGVQFQTGETYVVYANNDENSGLLSTTACTRTRRLSDAGDDLPYLFFYKNRREESTRLEGFTTADEGYQMDLDKMHDPETVRSAVSGVVIELKSDRLARDIETDSKGRFIFDGLDKGEYTLSAFARGYPSKTQLLAGPEAIHIEEKSCALRILLLPKTKIR